MQTKLAKILQDVQLKHHQQIGVEKTRRSNGSVLLDWEPGTGKTLGSEAIFEDLKEHNHATHALVLAPAQLKDNYLKNIKQFTDSKGVILSGRNETDQQSKFHIDSELPEAHYYITSNELFRKDPQKYLQRTKADTIILDEIQKFRDPNSENYKQMMSVRPMVKNVIGLTGTPLSNSPKDIVPLLDIVTNKHHHLGDYNQFDSRYLEKKQVTKGPLSFLGIGAKGTEVHLKNKGHLKEELNKYVSSYHEQSPDKPRKEVEEINVPMSIDQASIYNYVLKKHVDPFTRMKIKYNLPVESKEAKNIFTAILQARQASNSVHLFDKNISQEMAAEKTPKAKRLIDDVEKHLAENPKHKAIVYTNFYHGGIDILSAGLNKRGIKHSIYVGTGKMKTDQRSEDLKKYLSGEHRVQLINSAGAEGLDLPGTTGHFAYDGHFNPALIHQSEGRGIRTGSPVDKVVVKRYKSTLPFTWLEGKLGVQDWEPLKVMRGYSTDEWVYNTAKRKEKLNDEMKDLMKGASMKSEMLTKAANAAEEEMLEKIVGWIGKNPGKATGMALAGTAGAIGAGAATGAAIGIPGKIISKNIASSYPVSDKGIIAEHPYLSSLGTDVATGLATSVNPVFAPSLLARGPINQALAKHVIKKMKAKETEGVLGKYTQDNPRMGSFISSFVPGLHGINSVIAGESIANEAMKNKSFMSKHPILGAMGGSLIPGNASSYYNAAADIMTKDKESGLNSSDKNKIESDYGKDFAPFAEYSHKLNTDIGPRPIGGLPKPNSVFKNKIKNMLQAQVDKIALKGIK